jgi:hypothetical protein
VVRSSNSLQIQNWLLTKTMKITYNLLNRVKIYAVATLISDTDITMNIGIKCIFIYFIMY